MSDAFCVDRYRAEFLDLIRNGTVDLVFANERELHSLYQTADFDTAVKALRKRRAARRGDAQREGLPRGQPRGHGGGAGGTGRRAWSTRPGRATCSRPASWSGFRAGSEYRDAARLGALAAAEVIQHLGARPETSLKALAEENGLL